MERTQLINTVGTPDEPGYRSWRVRFGKTQLMCPKCDKWFSLTKDFTIDEHGNVSDLIYHFCNNESDEYPEESSWVVLAQLVGWQS